MKLSEYLKLSREERTKHVDLSTPCEVDEGVTVGGRRKRGRKALLEKFGLENDVENWAKGGVNVCHLCERDSTNGYCTNLQHLYLGTASENTLDQPEEIRKASSSAAGRKGGRRAFELGVGLFDPKNQSKGGRTTDQFPDPLWKQHLRLTEPCSFGGSTVTRLSQASFLGLDEGELTPLCNNRLCTNRAHWTFIPKGLRRTALREAAAERVKYLQGLRPDASTAELAKLANVSASLVRRLLREYGLRPAKAADGKSYSASHREARLRKLNGALSACERDLENHLGLLRQLQSVVEAELQSEQQ